MLKEDQNSQLFYVVEDLIPKRQLNLCNKNKSFKYGYNKDHDVVIISKDGTVGEIIQINGLNIALPLKPTKIHKRSSKKEEQFWEASEYPKALKSIPTIFSWNEMSSEFKERWIPFIEDEFNRREFGFWFYNNGNPAYITGSHYMYLQWTKIDVGKPDYR